MPSLSKKKVFRNVSLGEQPIEIQIRGGFTDKEINLDGFKDDPQVNAVLKAAEREAAYVKEKALAEAQELLTRAQNEKDAYVEAARQEGLALGYQEGFAEGGERAQLLQEQAESLLEEARKAYQGVMVQAEPNLLELALLLAEKIIRQQVVVAPEVSKTLAKELLKEMHAGETFLLHVHPEEARLLQEAQEELKEAAPVGAALHILPNKAISKGSCRLETEEGYLDATVEGQLLELKKLLQGGGENAKPG